LTVPASVAADVGRALGERGLGTRINTQPIGGGCIHHGARLDTDAGRSFFLKWNVDVPAGMFEAEAEGLAAIRASGTLRAPEPIAWGHAADGAGWLVLEYVALGRPSADTSARLGRGLAALHASATEPMFGWRRDNWIGSLAQANAPTMRWADFWRVRRLAPQLDLARQKGHLREVVLDRALDVGCAALADITRPELVHGDLWSGNWLVAENGEPVLIDPAVYLGHGEVDLAMSELFGGFERAFYEAYGITPEYRSYRRDLYQLYYLLVHVNLFGASYEAGALAAARRVVAELAG
jgi:protein-ribulosamine 3-kinase